MSEYYNYHKHTHISSIFLPDSNDHAEKYIKRTVDLGGDCYCTTEHGSLGDIFEAKTLCDKYKIHCKPGIEGYIVPNNQEKDKSNYHIVILPRTDLARKKVNYISSMANINGYYYRPRMQPSDLLQLDKDDVYITTACVAGLLRDSIAIEKILMPLYEHFGENLFLEVQAHNVDIQKQINEKALKLSEELGLRIVAACDSHYVYPEGKNERDELLRGKDIFYDDGGKFILDFPDYNTFFERFQNQGIGTDEQIREWLSNTLIFENVEDIQIDHSIKMPTEYPELSLDQRMELLEEKVWESFEKTKEKEHLTDEQIKVREEGIHYELKTVRDTNQEIHTADYFLLNTDIVDNATNEYGGILTRGGRGSAGSFYINKLLGMTQLDRFEINLPIYPDRFMSTARLLENRAMPDIDYNVEAQEPFVKATKDILGQNMCYPMIAYGTMKESEAFRNICRAKELDYDEFNVIAKDIDLYRTDPKWKKLIDEACRLCKQL